MTPPSQTLDVWRTGGTRRNSVLHCAASAALILVVMESFRSTSISCWEGVVHIVWVCTFRGNNFHTFEKHRLMLALWLSVPRGSCMFSAPPRLTTVANCLSPCSTEYGTRKDQLLRRSTVAPQSIFLYSDRYYRCFFIFFYIPTQALHPE